MARIALAIGGAVAGLAIGFATGNPFLGFQIGYAIGSIGGSLLFPGHTSQTGPRLSDMLVSSSANGAPIVFLYGGARLAGEIIWSSRIKETKTTSTQSAKGAPSQTTTTFSYTIDFDAAFCESDGSGTVSRIWGDSKLIFDRTSKGAIASDKLSTGIGNGMRIVVPAIYSGGASQSVDPTEQAALGIAATPAYRGLLRVVYTDFPLADFGNRLPNIRAECSSGEVTVYLKDTYPTFGVVNPYISAFASVGFTYLDATNRAAIILDQTGMVAERVDLSVSNRSPLPAWVASNVQSPGDQILDPNGHVQIIFSTLASSDRKTGSTIPTFTNTEGDFVVDNHVTWQNAGPGPKAIVVTSKGVLDPFTLPGDSFLSDGTPPGSAGVDTSGFFWNCVAITPPAAGTGYTWRAVKYDPHTFKAVGRISLPGPVLSYNFLRNTSGINLVVFTTDQSFTDGGKIYFVDGNSLRILASGSWLNSVETLTAGKAFPALDSNGVAYVCSYNLSNHHWGIVVLDPRGGFGLPRSYVFVSNATIGTPGSLLWNASDNSLIGLTETGYLIKVDVATMTVTATSAGEVFGTHIAYNSRFGKSFPGGQVPADGLIRFTAFEATHAHSIAIVSAITLATLSIIDEAAFFPAGLNNVLDQTYDIATNSLIVTVDSTVYSVQAYRIFLERQSVAGESLDNVVLDILSRAGLDSSLVDVSALSSTNVQGYPVTRNTDAKTILSVLTQAYFFDFVESDFKIKAVLRGGSSVMTIPEADLGLASENFAIQETIAQEHDLPKSIEIIYSDPALDYQTGKQRRYRPSRVVKTKNKTILELPLTLEADVAAQIAAKAMHVIWDERNQHASSLAFAKYLLLDPADVFVFVYKGAQYATRISKTNVGQDFTIKLEMASEDPRNYVSSAVGTSGSGFVSQVIDPTALTLLFLFDIPLLLDTDAPPAGSTGFYFAMTSPSLGWPGGVLFNSSDNEVFNQIGFSNTEVEYGIVSIATPAPLFSPFSWDRDTTLVVRMVQGTLASTTETNVLNGANAFILGSEVMQFQSATLNADGTYTLSNLLRGRRGTEGFCSSHVTGETFIHLGGGGIGRNLAATSIIGAIRYYKGVTVGLSKDSATPQTLALTGADLKPYAPSSIAGSRDGSLNLTITWIRRTRIGGGWMDGTGTVPLAEDSEAYQVDILDNTGIVKRTISGLSTATAAYSAADQTTDFGSAQASIAIAVYQISAQVGRGFPGKKTV